MGVKMRELAGVGIVARSRLGAAEVIRVAPYAYSRRRKRGLLHNTTHSQVFETTHTEVGGPLRGTVFLSFSFFFPKYARSGVFFLFRERKGGGGSRCSSFLDDGFSSFFIARHQIGGPRGEYKQAWESEAAFHWRLDLEFPLPWGYISFWCPELIVAN